MMRANKKGTTDSRPTCEYTKDLHVNFHLIRTIDPFTACDNIFKKPTTKNLDHRAWYVSIFTAPTSIWAYSVVSADHSHVSKT